MKLNKFLVAAAAVAVLPLSVANAEEAAVQPALPEFTGGVNPANAPTQPALPEFKGGVNGEGTTADPKYNVRPDGTQYSNGDDQGRAAVHNVPEFKGGVNAADAPVLDKPAYNPSKGTVRVDKGTEAPKADQAKKVLPRTSAVK